MREGQLILALVFLMLLLAILSSLQTHSAIHLVYGREGAVNVKP